MRKIIPIACLWLLPLIASAKNGFFLRPAVGFGVTNAQCVNFYMPIEARNIFAAEYELSAGYQMGRIGVSLGIGYMRTGYKTKSIIPKFDPVTHKATGGEEEAIIKDVFSHLLVPVHVSYNIPLNRFSLVPEAGVDVTYNIGVHASAKGPTTDESESLDGSTFHYLFSKFSFMAAAQLNLQFQATQAISVYGGPGGKYMFTNLLNSDVAGNQRQYNYAFLIHAGLIYNFQHSSGKHSHAADAVSFKH